MIKEILGTLSALSIPVKPLFTDSIEDCIVYTYNSLTDDGATAQKNLELRLITKTYENAEVMRKKIIELLVPIGDSIKIDGIYSCVLNGGGSLFDENTKTYHTLLYFNLVIRSENNEQ